MAYISNLLSPAAVVLVVLLVQGHALAGSVAVASASAPPSVNAIAFRDDGILGSGAENGQVTVWDVATGTAVGSLQAHGGLPVTSLSFSPNGTSLFSGGRDSVLKEWDVGTGQLLRVFQGHQAAIRAVAVSPSGLSAASGGEDTRILTWDLQSGKLSGVLSGHMSFVNGLAFAPNGVVLASAGEEARVKLWDYAAGQELRL